MWEDFEREWSANEDFIFPPFSAGQLIDGAFVPGPNFDNFESDWRGNENFKYPPFDLVDLEVGTFDITTTTEEWETFEDPNDWDNPFLL